MTTIRLLLLEDDEDDYILTRAILARISASFELDWAPTFDEALDLLSAGDYDVCLVDYRLGEHDGLELLRKPILERMPIIVLTGQDDPEVALRAMNGGAADYLVKGQFSASMLERSIRYSIERKRTRDELIKARDELDGLVLERTAELSEANAALRGREAELREADRRKDQFLAMLAHELRNPLAAIKNALAVARRSESPEHRAWSLDILDRQSSHLGRLIDDLLDVSRITTGKVRLVRRVVEASPILDQAVEAARPLIDGRKHTLEVSLDRGNLWMDADPTRLEQVAQNLLSNAAKYSEDGGRLWLRAGREGGDIVIVVKDAGIGIAPGKLADIFELFAQEDRSLARSEGGLGIGLTIVKKLVEMHGGSISVRSEGLGKGSEFTVRIPAAERPSAHPKATESPGDRSAARPKRFLVVDANADTADGTTRILRLLGHDVKTAYNGPAALEAARTYRPEVILLDIGLSGLDGFEVAARLRREEACKGVVLIAVSGYGQPEERRRSREAGFDHYIVKPIDHDLLTALLGPAR